MSKIDEMKTIQIICLAVLFIGGFLSYKLPKIAFWLELIAAGILGGISINLASNNIDQYTNWFLTGGAGVSAALAIGCRLANDIIDRYHAEMKRQIKLMPPNEQKLILKQLKKEKQQHHQHHKHKNKKL